MRKGKLRAANFKPKIDINGYLYNRFNNDLCHELDTEGGPGNLEFSLEINEEHRGERIPEPLEFFNLLYEFYEVVKENKAYPTAIVEHFDALELNHRTQHFLLYSLIRLFRYEAERNINVKEDEQLDIALSHLDFILDLLNQRVYFFYESKGHPHYPISSYFDENYNYDEKYEENVDANFDAYKKNHWCNVDLTNREIKIIFKPAVISTLFNFLKEFFPEEQQAELKCLLEGGRDVSEPLYFMDRGNRLVDAFKRLKEADIITGCNKKELQNWICRNFVYKKTKEEQAKFTTSYAEQVFSDRSRPCKNPLRFEIKGGEILEII